MLEIKPDRILARGSDGELHGVLAIKGNSGDKGDPGNPGSKGDPGKKGDDGFSPRVSITNISGGHRITITDAEGSKSADIMNGTDASVTYVSVTEALGYTPANSTEVRGELDTLSGDVTELYDDVDALNEGIANKLSKPTEGIAVGKYFRVASIDAEGNPVLEACDLPTGNISTKGVFKTSYMYGIKSENGVLQIDKATDSQVENGVNNYMPIVPANRDKFVKSALSASNTSANAWTDTEKANACQRLGAYNPNKPWVLKGTLTTENKDTGVSVDLSGCTEMFIRSTITATSTTGLKLGSLNIGTDFTQNGTRYSVAHIKDTLFGFYGDGRYGVSNTPNTFLRITSYPYREPLVFIKDISSISFVNASVITSCNIEIYAR